MTREEQQAIFDAIRERSDRPGTFNAVNGVRLTALCDGGAEGEVRLTAQHLNPLGIVHGGAMYTMADCAAGIVVNTDGRRHVTQGSSMHYLKNRTEGVIRASGRVVHRGKATSLVHVEITDETGALLASGEFTFFCLDANQ